MIVTEKLGRWTQEAAVTAASPASPASLVSPLCLVTSNDADADRIGLIRSKL